MPDKKAIIVGFASAVVIFLTLFFSGLSILNDPFMKEIFSFTWTASLIGSEYPLPFSQGTALQGAEAGMFSTLDPFSYRIGKKDYDFMREEYSGQYGGIGISVAPRDTLLMVLSVRKGSPADTSGMKSGDYIVRVNGADVPRDDPRLITDSIRGASGTIVHITVFRPRIQDTLSLNVLREDINLEHIPYAGLTGEKVAYISMADFESGAAADLFDTIQELEKQNPIGYIIDLTNNPGGYLLEAIDAADIFLDDGELVVGTDSRSRWEKRQYFSKSDPLTDKPVVILTDKGTASAAEILTGAMRGVDRAVVVGDTTFGKGLVQSVFALSNEDAIRLTISRYYFADGRFLNPRDSTLSFSGLAPDVDYKSAVEFEFQRFILGGFALYDFVEQNYDFLASLPDNFTYPDTVLAMFGEFLEQQHLRYQSKLTGTMDLIIRYQAIELASDKAIKQLKKLRTLSEKVDGDTYRRYADFVLYHIRRLAVEHKSGMAASYKDVIVPHRGDIRIAVDLLLNPAKYDSLLHIPIPVANTGE